MYRPVQLKLREILNPVFAEFDVNLYVCGHYHNCEYRYAYT